MKVSILSHVKFNSQTGENLIAYNFTESSPLLLEKIAVFYNVLLI